MVLSIKLILFLYKKYIQSYMHQKVILESLFSKLTMYGRKVTITFVLVYDKLYKITFFYIISIYFYTIYLPYTIYHIYGMCTYIPLCHTSCLHLQSTRKKKDSLVKRANKEVSRHITKITFATLVKKDWVQNLPFVGRVMSS